MSRTSSSSRKYRPRHRDGTRAGAFGWGVDELAWMAMSVYTLGAIATCARAARGEDERAYRFASSLRLFAAPCALYAALLIRSWTPETLSLMMPGSLEEGLATGKTQFIPTLSSIMTLLSARATATSAWAHLLCLNLFVARHVALKTRERVLRRGHAPPIAHTLVLSTIVGPLALLSHVFTTAAYDAARGGVEDVREDDDRDASLVVST